MANLKNTIINDTQFLQLPKGTTAQRPSSPQNGYIRFNIDLNNVEGYIDGSWVQAFSFFEDNFGGNSLNLNNWEILNPSGLTINVSSDTLKLSNSSGGVSGIVAKTPLLPGQKLIVRSRSTSGRHHVLIGIGRGAFFPFPHANAETQAATLYGRHDNSTSTTSFRDENNITGFVDGVGNPRNFLIYEIHYISVNQILIFRSGILVHTINQLFDQTYFPFFTMDTFNTPNSLEVDYIKIEVL